jgi:hypothetical protein
MEEARQIEAEKVYNKLIVQKRLEELSFLNKGKLLAQIKDKKLYKQLEFNSFIEFLKYEENLNIDKVKAYQLIRVYKFYIEKLGFQEDFITKISFSKLAKLVPVIKSDCRNKYQAKQLLLKKNKRKKIYKYQRNKWMEAVPKVKKNKEGLWEIKYYEDRSVLSNLGKFKKKLN